MEKEIGQTLREIDEIMEQLPNEIDEMTGKTDDEYVDLIVHHNEGKTLKEPKKEEN